MLSYSTVGDRGESTHGHVKDVIGVDIGDKLSGFFFCITIGSSIGGMFSGLVISILRPSFVRLTLSYFTVGDRGESTHGHVKGVIGVDIGVKYGVLILRLDQLSWHTIICVTHSALMRV